MSPVGLSLWHQPGEPARPQESRNSPRREGKEGAEAPCTPPHCCGHLGAHVLA